VVTATPQNIPLVLWPSAKMTQPAFPLNLPHTIGSWLGVSLPEAKLHEDASINSRTN
jgi:hypothetical protein